MPKPLPHILICTTGTSLVTWLQSLPQDDDLRRAYDSRGSGQVARQLAERHRAGSSGCAEIASIDALLEHHLIAPTPHVHLCHSDTEDGKSVAQVLRLYCQHRSWQASVHLIDNLQDADPQAFATRGLRNLTRTIAKIHRDAGSSDYCAINATGGYKAMLGVAVLVGQALGVPVFYQHERFSRIIAVPPMPLAFDWSLLDHHADLLIALEKEDGDLDDSDIPPEIKPFLDEIPSGAPGRVLCALSPFGQVYLESFRARHPIDRTLPRDARSDERRPPTFRDDHYPKGFKDFVHTIWQTSAYVTTCYSLPYDGQKGIRNRRFRVEPGDEPRIVAEFQDGDRFGARAAILTTATTEEQRTAIVCNLTSRLGCP